MDDMEDILAPRRTGLDLTFSLRKKESVPHYKHMKSYTTAEVKQLIMSSQRLKHTISKIVSEQGVDKRAVEKEASEILDEMAHTQTMSNIRILAFLLPKLRQVTKEAPVILLPTHRSYMDFLTISFVCYHYDVPLPFIAAGQDFNAMSIVNTILRRAGAFYIRRSFGSDSLYWAIFTEYVQVNVINGELPLEFFLEGTRSRTGKFLPPKTGLLGTALEPLFTGKVPDLYIVPVSITYDRIIEELLHSREMLGIPKPKESTSGLIKARSILQDDYGDIVIHVGDPISAREFSTPRVNRTVHNLLPRYLFNLSADEQDCVRDLAFLVQSQQSQHVYISVWVLCATLLLQQPSGYKLRDLCRDVEWLKDLVVNFGVKVSWQGTQAVESRIQTHLRRHYTFVTITHKNGITMNVADRDPHPHHMAEPQTVEEVTSLAIVPVGVAMYKNHLLSYLANFTFLAVSFYGKMRVVTKDLFLRFWFLHRLFQKEFVLRPSVVETEFGATLKRMASCSMISINEEDKVVDIQRTGERPMQFLSDLIQPFLRGYWMVCQYLIHSPCLPENDNYSSKVAKHIQCNIAERILQGQVQDYETLSLNMLNNALSSLVDLHVISKITTTSSNRGSLSWKTEKVMKFLSRIGEFIPTSPDLAVSISKPIPGTNSVNLTSKK